jgi:apolipoprotein N-acyltransferase
MLFAFLAQAGSPVSGSLASLAWMAFVPGVYAAAGAWLTRRVGFSPYLLALGWVGVEFSLQPTGLQFGLLAATQGDGFALRIVGAFAGYVLVAFSVAYFNAALLSALTEVVARVVRSRPVRRGGSIVRKFFSQDAVLELRDFLHLARPRGPPVFSLAIVRR